MTMLKEERKERLFRFAPAIVIVLFLVMSPTFVSLPLVGLLTKILIFALLVMSLDLLVGYTGLWAFGHAAFFGLGAYTTGILIKHFAVTSFWISAPAGVLMSVVAAAIFGLIALRVSGIYFLLITFALGQLVYGIVSTSAQPMGALTGGIYGFSGIPYPDLGLGLSFSPTSYYYFVLVVVIICALLLYLITKSPFGHGLQGIRDNEIRMRCLGYNTWLYKYIAFVVAGLFAGVAGVLYIHYSGVIDPPAVGIGRTGILWLMLIIGSAGTLWGAVIGSGVLLSLEYFVAGFAPERWPLIMGVCFVAVVMFFRGGIFIHLRNIWERVSNHGHAKS